MASKSKSKAEGAGSKAKAKPKASKSDEEGGEKKKSSRGKDLWEKNDFEKEDASPALLKQVAAYQKADEQAKALKKVVNGMIKVEKLRKSSNKS
jgi:hypothetical protein